MAVILILLHRMVAQRLSAPAMLRSATGLEVTIPAVLFRTRRRAGSIIGRSIWENQGLGVIIPLRQAQGFQQLAQQHNR